MSPFNRESILIAICTLGENPNLSDLLSQLIRLRSGSPHQIRIIIVWNSNIEVGISIPHEVEVYRISERGYSNARNLALALRSFDESMMFIDDDELIKLQLSNDFHVGIDILDVYLTAAIEFPDSIFVGPYLPVDMDGRKKLPDYKHIPKMEYGQVINFGSGGNFFIPSRVFRDRKVSYDPFYNFGGEDTNLVRSLARSGIMTRWIPSAVLYEKTPSERYTIEWQTERKLKNFLINIMIELQSLESSRIKRFFFAIKILIVIFLGIRNPATKHLGLNKKLGITIAIFQHNLQKLKQVATNSGDVE